MKPFLKTMCALLLVFALLLSFGCGGKTENADATKEYAITDPLLLGSSPATDNARVFY